MPKKNNELKAKAKELYEQGFSLVNIAQELNISAGTVRGWKSKDKKNGNAWNVPKPGKRSKNRSNNVSKTSLKNLEQNKQPPFKPDNKVALKHGLRADNSDQPEYKEHLAEVSELSEEEIARKVLDMSLANLLTAIEVYGAGSPQFLEAFTRVTSMIANIAEKPGKIRATNLDNRMKEYDLEKIERSLTGNNPQLDVIREYIEAVKLDAARDADFDNQDNSDT